MAGDCGLTLFFYSLYLPGKLQAVKIPESGTVGLLYLFLVTAVLQMQTLLLFIYNKNR